MGMLTLNFREKAVRQLHNMDCGPACLSFISAHHGKKYSLQYLRKICYISRRGVSLSGIIEGAERIRLSTFSTKLTISDLIKTSSTSPCIIHWNQNHFVVLKKIKIKKNNERIFYLMDPRFGFIKLKEHKFKQSWLGNNKKGIAAFFEPNEFFLTHQLVRKEKFDFRSLLKYVLPYKSKFLLLVLMIALASAITFAFPFLTKALIDEGIENRDLTIIQLILLAQLSLFLGSVMINIVRNWVTLYIGTYISVNLITDFITKLIKLPMKHFDTQMIGDLNQRIIDNERIERLITTESVTIFFSIISFFVFFFVLFYFNTYILSLYLILTIIAILWSIIWLKKRKLLDFYEFQIKSKNQDSIFEIFSGIRDMKLFQLEKFKINQWKDIQSELLKINIKILKYNQIQIAGYRFINKFKNIVVTYLAASLVVQDKMSLGTLLSISYIIGEMNNPIAQLINFLRNTQDAKLSFQRLSEITSLEDEEKSNYLNFNEIKKLSGGIELKNLNFSYGGSNSIKVLDNINVTIPNSKVTAIVGHSGSGKTTMMKLLLRFYKPSAGSILINNQNLSLISPNSLRENIGTVLQDGFIFSESIARNVVANGEDINPQKLENALKLACIFDFVESLPLKSNTIIGSLGNDLSTGQKQRIFIARAIYKNPDYLFLDEATSALDAKTEKMIHNNLENFFTNKTVIIIAHRLSTVKNADNIIVLESGQVKEAGNHQELIKKRGVYFELVHNQLELSK